MSVEVEKLHDKFKTFETIELCEILIRTVKAGGHPILIRIIKTYLARSLAKEGIE